MLNEKIPETEQLIIDSKIDGFNTKYFVVGVDDVIVKLFPDKLTESVLQA